MSYARSEQADLALRAQLTTRAAVASVVVALLLLALKSYAVAATGSVAMLGSMADTALDVAASLITLLGVRVAAAPADEDHRFGHGKAEALAAMVQVGIIAVSAVAIGWRAVERLISGEVSARAEAGVAVSAIAIVATFGLLAYQRHVIRRTGSVAIRTDNVHYQSDLLLNGAVIVALLLEQVAALRGADPVFGIAIAAWLMLSAWRASIAAVDQLMDKEWPEEKRRRFVAVAGAHPKAHGLHDLRTRSSGSYEFAQFHIWVAADMTVAQAHDVMDDIEDAIVAEFPGVEVLIHLDPEGKVDTPERPWAERDETRR